jgi:hypothetical protein
MGTAESINENTVNQLHFALLDIAETASYIRRLCIDAVQSGSDIDDVAFNSCTAIRLAERIGYIADLCQTKIGGRGEVYGDAENWMMPPAYHSANEESGACK